MRGKKKKDSGELRQSWDQWKEHPNDQNMTQLLERAEPVISSALQTFAGGKEDPVYELEAQRRAARAFRTYDPNRGAKLDTHLFNQLKPITRTVHKRAQPLKIPKMAWSDLQNLNKTEEQLNEDLGREPSTTELADGSGLSQKRITHLRRFRGSGLPAGLLRDQDPEQLMTLGTDEPENWWFEAVYHSLDHRDQKIVDWRLGAHGQPELSTKEIAHRLGISAPRVSQRVNDVIEKLQSGA